MTFKLEWVGCSIQFVLLGFRFDCRIGQWDLIRWKNKVSKALLAQAYPLPPYFIYFILVHMFRSINIWPISLYGKMIFMRLPSCFEQDLSNELNIWIKCFSKLFFSMKIVFLCAALSINLHCFVSLICWL